MKTHFLDIPGVFKVIIQKWRGEVSQLVQGTIKCVFFAYSSVPNRRAGQNKRAGGKILRKTIKVQGRINVQGGNFLENK